MMPLGAQLMQVFHISPAQFTHLVAAYGLAAAVLLLVTVVASFFASMGAGWFLFQNFFGFPALDLSVFLYSFLFLVALGVDYNIFLVTRA